MTRDQLCTALRSNWYLTPPEIDAILVDKGFFHPYLREALAKRANLGRVPESPIDATDCHAIFFLTELEDTSFIPDLLKCLRMREADLRDLYGDVLTEHMWLPFTRLGFNSFDQLWQFATDTAVYEYSRHAAIRGVLTMHHFHPERRSAAVEFVERLLTRTDCFPVDHLAGILCDCADSGLMELTDPAQEFAARMIDEGEEPYPMATADDVLRAFADGPRRDFVTGRPHTVYAVNREWQKWAASREGKKDRDEAGEFSVTPNKSKELEIRRNDPCPCGSGKKYKKCHGI